VAGHPGAVAIVALDADDQGLLVRPYRSPAERVLLEIPAGTLDVDETTGETEDPEIASRRELEEETGYRAATWRKLASFWTAPGFASELMHLYLATDLSPAHPDERLGPDEDEHLRLDRLPFDDAVRAALAGEISDAKSIVGLLWVDRLRRAEAATGVATAASSAPRAHARAGDAPRIERTFKYTVREFVRTNMAVMRRSRFVQVFGLVIAAFATLPLVVGDWSDAVPGFAFVLLVWTGLFSVPFALFAAWRYRDRLFQPTTISIDGHSIRYEGQQAHSQIAWATFSRLRESDGFLWLEFGPQAVPIPLRIFTPEELPTIRRLAAEAGFGPDGRRREQPPSAADRA
jgi:ADP-ribose pyrophosphatase